MVAVTLGFFTFWVVIVYNYLKYVTRIFQERPIFSIPRGVPSPDAEDLVVPTIDGQNLKACYLSSLVEGTRKGVVLFGIEFGSNRWSCQHHAEFLRRAGYDVLSWEPRGQGESDKIPKSIGLELSNCMEQVGKVTKPASLAFHIAKFVQR